MTELEKELTLYQVRKQINPIKIIADWDEENSVRKLQEGYIVSVPLCIYKPKPKVGRPRIKRILYRNFIDNHKEF